MTALLPLLITFALIGLGITVGHADLILPDGSVMTMEQIREADWSRKSPSEKESSCFFHDYQMKNKDERPPHVRFEKKGSRPAWVMKREAAQKESEAWMTRKCAELTEGKKN